MKTIYIAGPMTGLPENNYPAFNTAEQQLRAAGYDVLNPVTSSSRSDAPVIPDAIDDMRWDDYMRNGINQLIRADGIALLPDWFKSKGARIEEGIAQQLGMIVRDVDGWLHAREGAPA